MEFTEMKQQGKSVDYKKSWKMQQTQNAAIRLNSFPFWRESSQIEVLWEYLHIKVHMSKQMTSILLAVSA